MAADKAATSVPQCNCPCCCPCAHSSAPVAIMVVVAFSAWLIVAYGEQSLPLIAEQRQRLAMPPLCTWHCCPPHVAAHCAGSSCCYHSCPHHLCHCWHLIVAFAVFSLLLLSTRCCHHLSRQQTITVCVMRRPRLHRRDLFAQDRFVIEVDHFRIHFVAKIPLSFLRTSVRAGYFILQKSI